MNSKALVAKLRKLWAWIMRTYQKEIRAMAKQIIDDYVSKVTTLSKEELEKIKSKSPELVKRAIDRCMADKIDISSEQGKMWLNAIVNKYLDEAQKEGKQ